MDSLTVERISEGKEFSYDIIWREDFTELATDIHNIDGLNPGKLCIVADSNVASLYLDEVKEQLNKVYSNVFSFVFPAGEQNKHLGTVSNLYRYLIENHFERSDILIALGGGVTGDLTGFAAASYLRGINFVQVPTTLLAQVDSSVGGKTGVDFEQYKNMVGAFHQPSLVYMNTSVLKTLPDDQFASGMGEVLKTGLIRNRDLTAWIRDNREKIAARDNDSLSYVIRECCKVKAAVVEEDPKEKGVRAILNFGHTLGHAVEKLKNFELLHGQCVGIGMIAASRISLSRGLITPEEFQLIEDMNRYFRLPVSVSGLTEDDIISVSKSDKKMQNGQIKFILLDGIGNAIVDRTVTDAELLEASNYILE